MTATEVKIDIIFFINNYCKNMNRDATILFSMLLSLRLLFWRISSSPDFLSNPWLLRQNPCFLRWNTVLPWFLHAVPRTGCATGEGRSLGWHGGVLDLLRVLNRACSLTWQSDSWFRIPDRLLFPLETREQIPTDHLWIGPCNSAYNLTIYPPLYLLKRFFPFICHDLTQLREYNQVFPPYHSFHWENKRWKCFCWSWKCLLCLSFLIIYHLARSVVIGSYF